MGLDRWLSRQNPAYRPVLQSTTHKWVVLFLYLLTERTVSMKKRTLFLILMHIAILSAMALGVLKFSEEITALKSSGYGFLQQAKSGPAVTFADVEDLAPFEENGDAWHNRCDLIYHAAGGLDGLDYSNSRDALEHTLALGNRFIEIDFRYTSDGQLVCARDWADITKDGTAPSSEDFRDLKIYGKFATMTGRDLIGFMEAYPDLYIIIDTKENGAVQVVTDLAALCAGDETILSRFIIQLYDFESKAAIVEAYPFPDDQFLFTAYKYGTGKPAEILKNCYEQNIRIITVPHGAWSDQVIAHFTEKGFVLYEHTVNRPDEAREALARGIRGLYTDFLSPADLA